MRVSTVPAVCVLSLLATLSAAGRCAEPPQSITSDEAAKTSETHSDTTPRQDYGQAANLPRPSQMTVNEFEQILYDFVNSRRYLELGWCEDKSVRDTGPYLRGNYYGTHPAVRIYYSPEMIQWLVGGREAAIPDGAMMIKEQFKPPAARYAGFNNDQLWESLESWTIMVKDSQGSHDGWFWSNPAKNQKVVNYHEYPFEEPYSGFGLYCVRCHGATKSPGLVNEFTFAALRNVKGFPGKPLLFRVDNSWRTPSAPKDLSNEKLLEAALAAKTDAATGNGTMAEIKASDAHPRCAEGESPTPCIPELNTAFARLFPNMRQCDRAEILHFPPVTYDSVPRQSQATRLLTNGGDSQQFLTSNQCMSCHAGITEPFGPTMFIPTGESAGYGEPGLHVSPYGEWRWTPMGLAGRDPVFYAQLDSELALLAKEFEPQRCEELSKNLVQTCLGCHGVMGKRQHDFDLAEKPSDTFAIADVYRQEINPHDDAFNDAKYGALARDGVSCAVCHRMQPRPQPADDTRSYLEHFLDTSITGNIFLGPPGEIYGPYKDNEIAPYIMEHSVGLKPKHSPYIQQSQMCGSCHTVNLPAVDFHKHADEQPNDLMLAERNPAFQDFHHHVEQATYLEWLNSEFENEFNPENPKAKSCQDCHMSQSLEHEGHGIDLTTIATRIAAVQDETYPDAENLAEHHEIGVRHREQEYNRHNFRGLNVFLIEMFNQFDDVLGVRKHDYMTGSKLDIQHAVDDFVRQANHDTMLIELSTSWSADGELLANVDLHSLVGHRFPSGVGFRRAFLEVLVIDDSKPQAEAIVWSSGRTDEAGVIVDHAGQPLASEFFADTADGQQQYQPHHAEITSSQQVQIYETLLQNQSQRFTTSFVHGCTIIKDNRFLPRGWSRQGPGAALNGNFLSATYPGPIASKDPRYQDGSGSDQIGYRMKLSESVARDRIRVTATLYYQAIPPYFLKNIFDTVPDSPAAIRLHAICSNLKLQGTAIENWKLKIVAAESQPLPKLELRNAP